MNSLVYLYLDRIQRYDIETFQHSCRVSNLSYLIGQYLSLSINDLELLKNAAYLHDLGKTKVSKNILNKKEILLSDEWNQIQNHPNMGSQLLKRTRKPVKQISDIILAHHEKWDGSGYPNGLQGEEIPYPARIIALADALDAMITTRPYRIPILITEAYSEVDRCKERHFDPYVAKALLKIDANKLNRVVYDVRGLGTNL
jgi:putative nucleotidyltransferase with HDIG domain